MEQPAINLLIEKYLAGTATAAEEEALLNWYRSQDMQEVEWPSDDPLELDKLRNRVLANLHTHMETTRKRVPVMHSRWIKVAAAAAVLITVSLFIYLGSKNSHTTDRTLAGQPAGTAPIRNDRLPGGNNATLTLANGSVITLDTLQNGIIAKQGDAQFNKTGDGQLAYQQGASGQETTIAWNTLTIPRGGQYRLTLPDGTKVWLNSASTLNFPTAFAGNERKVTLTGEAYFEVAKDKAKPFRVLINDMQVEVLGTHFNVNGYENEGMVKTTLLEGKVNVKTPAGQPVVLDPGQQARLNAAGTLKVFDNVNLQETIAWKEGMFVFDNTDIRSILRQLERWYDVEVNYTGLPARYFNGMISRNVNLSEVLKMMEVTSKIKFRIEDRKIMMQD